jgi:hypothetical protein
MTSNNQPNVFLLCTIFSAFGFGLAIEAQAVGVLYGDPGWLHAFDGNSAYYHDPDGPHPDYVNGANTNEPGGQGGWAALIDVRPCSGSCDNEAIWQNRGSEWEGSAPGDPLGGPPNPFGTVIPPVPAPAPGGVGAFLDGSTTFIRIQDPGLPNPYGWADKGAQLDTNTPKQEGNNRRIEFVHQMTRDAGFSGTQAILDDGITLSFRIRISTAATGPLDDIYDEDGPSSRPWPTDGMGYPVANNGRGMIMISQGTPNSATPPGRLAFSLLDNNTVSVSQGGSSPIVLDKRGLVMNSQFNPARPLGSPDTNEATLATGNIAEIENEELADWQEFWITVQALPAPVNGNTHEVNVYMNGSQEAETFQVFLANQNEAGNGSYLGMGLSSGSRWGAFDLDYIAYKEGVHPPVVPPAGLDGDFNDDGKVDAADYVLWRKNNGTSNALPNDGGLGTPIGAGHYDLWRGNFGGMGAGTGAALGAVPEPAAATLGLLAAIACAAVHRRRR